MTTCNLTKDIRLINAVIQACLVFSVELISRSHDVHRSGIKLNQPPTQEYRPTS